MWGTERTTENLKFLKIKIKLEKGRNNKEEGEEEGERGRIWKPKTKRKWMRERARSNIDSKEL
jgi:hypothetical protein